MPIRSSFRIARVAGGRSRPRDAQTHRSRVQIPMLRNDQRGSEHPAWANSGSGSPDGKTGQINPGKPDTARVRTACMEQDVRGSARVANGMGQRIGRSLYGRASGPAVARPLQMMAAYTPLCDFLVGTPVDTGHLLGIAPAQGIQDGAVALQHRFLVCAVHRVVKIAE